MKKGALKMNKKESVKSIEERKLIAANTNELLEHLIDIIEQNDERFSFEFA